MQVNPDDIRLESVKGEAGHAVPYVLGSGAHGKARLIGVETQRDATLMWFRELRRARRGSRPLSGQILTQRRGRAWCTPLEPMTRNSNSGLDCTLVACGATAHVSRMLGVGETRHTTVPCA